MSKPIRIQLSRKKGWRMPPNTVIVSRPSKWGNPHWRGTGCRMTAAHCFRCDLLLAVLLPMTSKDPYRWMAEHIEELRGKNLACWCPLDMPDYYCHAGVLLELANR